MAYTPYPSAYPYYAPYAPVQSPQQTAQASAQNGIIWIQGEAAAKSYLVAPNNSIVLFDSESQTIYIKSADASGMPSMKILDYTIRDQTRSNGPIGAAAQAPITSTDFATHAEIDALTARIDAIKAEMDSMTKKGAKLNE